MEILNIAFYKFIELGNLSELSKFKDALYHQCESLSIKGTILISSEGINGSLAGAVKSIRIFQNFLLQELNKGPHQMSEGLEYKESYSSGIPFKNLFIKIKKEIIPTGDFSIRPAKSTAPRISAQELKRWLDENRDFDLLDTRNTYEIEYGTFQKAVHLDLHHFRDFSKHLDSSKNLRKNSNRPLVMFCTGGIRCEKASVIAMQQGYKEVYQLDGGILKYFEDCGSNHYQGSCFVFDERIALNSRLEESQS